MESRKQIIDNDGFLALVDVSKYSSYLTENWELDELLDHFVDQMNRGNFLMWRTGYEGGEWNVDMVSKPSDKKSFREFKSLIEVTNGRLYLTEYSDLTMAASYADQRIPSKHNSDVFFELENGIYGITVRQLFNPDSDDEGIEEEPNFELVLEATKDVKANNFEVIQWHE